MGGLGGKAGNACENLRTMTVYNGLMFGTVLVPAQLTTRVAVGRQVVVVVNVLVVNVRH